MSSSSDIEKLFDHFGGDANAYQEIGRENEARSARTRWPLLVTLDLTQPAIPAIGLHREPKTQPPVSAAPSAVDRQDATPKDVAAVTRAKAPLFTRSHRRDIPPVVVAAAQPAAPSGASRFGALEAEEQGAAQGVSAGAGIDAVARVAQPVPAAAAPTQPASILGKLFAAAPQPAPPQPVAPVNESAPLQAVFDRLRGAPAQTSATPASASRAAAPGVSNSWLVNGPRRS